MLTMNNGYLMLKCLFLRSDQKIQFFGIGHARQFMFIFATIFLQSTIFCVVQSAM